MATAGQAAGLRSGVASNPLLRPCPMRSPFGVSPRSGTAGGAFRSGGVPGRAAAATGSRPRRAAAALQPLRAAVEAPPAAADAAASAVPAVPASAADKPAPSTAYPFAAIEPKWQQYWEANQTFRTPDQVDMTKPKYYVLDMFPYPRCAAAAAGGRGGGRAAVAATQIAVLGIKDVR